MNKPMNANSSKLRLPLAVVAAGSIAMSGVAIGGLPAAGASLPSVNPAAAETAATVYPIYNKDDRESEPVADGEQLLRINESDSKAQPGKLIVDVPAAIVKAHDLTDNDVVTYSASSTPNAGQAGTGIYKNGQFVIDSGSTDAYDPSQIARQISYGFSIPQDPKEPITGERAYVGGVTIYGGKAARVVTPVVEKLDDLDLVKTGADELKIHVPDGHFKIDEIVLNYFSQKKQDIDGNGFVEMPLVNFSQSGNTITIKDADLAELTQGRGYSLNLREAGSSGDRYSIFFGMYDPAPEPTEEPTAEPTAEPTPEPTEEPTAEPTEEPTAEPTPEPTAEPTEEPTEEPTAEPTPEPTEEPTAEPTPEPTAEPTEEPTAEPTEEPTVEPTPEPTAEPTSDPTAEPTPEPTEEPTAEPTPEPTAEPTEEPTAEPTEEPTVEPTVEPTPEPTAEPTSDPTAEPTPEPTAEPTAEPTNDPTALPTTRPSEVPEAQAPESGNPVAPNDQKLKFNAQDSSPNNGDFVFDAPEYDDDASVEVTYKTAPSAEAKSVSGSIVNGQLRIKADSDFTDAYQEYQQLLVTFVDSEGNSVSAVLAGANSMFLASDLVDDRLGVPLAAKGDSKWVFDLPSKFPEVANEKFQFDIHYIDSEGQPALLDDVAYEVSGTSLVVNDSRVSKATEGTYFISGSASETTVAGTASVAASNESITVSSWFGIYEPAAEPSASPSSSESASPSDSAVPSNSPSVAPSESTTEQPSESQSTTPSATGSSQPSQPSHTSRDERTKSKDQLADTGVDGNLLVLGATALALLAGGILFLKRRSGKHS